MTDRELLEMAAKAAGLNYNPTIPGDHITYRGDDGGLYTWNPLNDDGDALRLAVKLGIKVEPKDGFVFVYSDNPDATQLETIVDNAYATTRHAIVLAAAELGRGME